MKTIVAPRRGGKTTKAISWILEDVDNRILLTINHASKGLLLREWPDLTNNIYTWEEYLRGHLRGKQQTEIAIDNADLLLQELTAQRGGTLKLITITE